MISESGGERSPTLHPIANRRSLIYWLLWVAFFNGIAAALISLYSLKSGHLPDTQLGWLYLILQQIGHFQFLSWFVAIPLILLAVLIPVRRFVRFLGYLGFLCFLVLVYADYVIFQLYRFHINSMVVELVFGGAAEEILIFESAQIFGMLAVMAILMVVQWVVFFLVSSYQKQHSQSLGKWVALLVLVVQLSGQGIHAWADAIQKPEIISQVRFIPLAAPLKMKRFLRKNGWLPESSKQSAKTIRSSGDFQYPLRAMKCDQAGSDFNLMVILIDGLRSDMLNAEVMPFWSKLSTQSFRFNNHFSSGNATRFGVFGLLSGLHGHYWFDAVSNQTTSVLISELKRRQYRFGFFANARLTSPEFDRAIFYQVKDMIPASTSGRTVVERELNITNQAKAFIETETSSPFFALVFFDAPHAYKYPPEDTRFTPVIESINYLSLDNSSDPLPFKNRYKNSISFDDRLTEDIFQSLKQSGQLDNTIVVLTGDHGQEMNETGTNSWGHNSNFSHNQIQVPMLIHWPGKLAASYNHVSSHVDLVPTLMKDWLGCSNEVSDFSNGRSLFNESKRDYVISKNWNNHAVIESEFTHVFTLYGAEKFRNDNYQKSDIASRLDSSLQLKVLESMSQFYDK